MKAMNTLPTSFQFPLVQVKPNGVGRSAKARRAVPSIVILQTASGFEPLWLDRWGNYCGGVTIASSNGAEQYAKTYFNK